MKRIGTPLNRVNASESAIDLLYAVDRIRLVRRLVGAVAFESGEPERDATWILGTPLDFVEGHLHHQLGTDVHRDSVPRDLQLLELPGLPLEHLVGHPL